MELFAELLSNSPANVIKKSVSWMKKSVSPLATQKTNDSFIEKPSRTYKLHSKVFFINQGTCGGGTVEWTGVRQYDDSFSLVAVRLTEDVAGASDEIFESQQLATPPGRFLLLSESHVGAIQTLLNGDFCYIRHGYPSAAPCKIGFVEKLDDQRYAFYPMEVTSGVISDPLELPDYALQKAPPPITEERSDYVPPISPDNLPLFCGRNKGIQGKNNSCYLDTLLFSLFAFSDAVLDDLTTKEATGGMSEEFNVILSILRYQIVFPLRASHFVSDSHVEFLRRYMGEKLNDEKFETETRDIPECLEALFEKFLSWRPSLEIGDLSRPEVNFYQSIATELVWCEGLPVPTTAQLLENAAVTMSFCFKMTPRKLLLQLPRDLDRTTYLIPSLAIDLNLLLYDTVKVCVGCGRNARFQFSELYEVGSLSSTFLCRACAEGRGLKIETGRPLPEPMIPDGDEPETRMLLSAVICIERSHYNCFVRCGSGGPEDRWVFFDSMSDREELLDPVTFRMSEYNIPLVEEVNDLCTWLEQATILARTEGSLQTLFDSLDEPARTRAQRILRNPYLAVYDTV